MILGLSRVAMRTTDVLVVGFLGTWAVASVGLGDVWMRILLFVALGLGTGSLSRVAQAVGADDPERRDHAVTQTVLWAVVTGVAATVLYVSLSDSLVRLLGAEEDLVETAGLYLHIIGWTAVPRLIYLSVFRAMSGAGDTRTPVAVGVSTTTINIVLTVLLVFGWGPAPEMGFTGAAVGTAVGNILAGSTCLIILAIPHYPLHMTTKGWSQWGEGWAVLRIGTPRAFGASLPALSEIPFNAILLWFGETAVAGFQIAKRAQMLAVMPNWGISTAAGTFSGQHAGREEYTQSREQGWLAVKLALLISAPVAGLIAWFRESVAYVFIREPETLAIAAQFLVVYAVVILLTSIHRNLGSALEGAGNSVFPMVATATGIAVLLGGSAYLAGPVGWGLMGVFMALVGDHLTRTGLIVWRYRWFRW